MQVSVIFVIISVPTVHFQGLNQLECVWISSVAFWSGARDCRVCTFTLPSQDLRLRWFYDEIGKRCEEETGELAGAVLVAASVLCFTVTASLTTEKKKFLFSFLVMSPQWPYIPEESTQSINSYWQSHRQFSFKTDLRPNPMFIFFHIFLIMFGS